MNSAEDSDAQVLERVATESHAAVLGQKHTELMRSMPWLVVALALAGIPLVSLQFAPLVFLAPFPLLWVGHRLYEWWIVYRADPVVRHVSMELEEAELRTHEWLAQRVTPYFTFAVAGVIGLVSSIQFAGPGFEPSVARAALVKPAVWNGGSGSSFPRAA